MSATAVVLAAGKGTRMKSDLAKVLFPVNGRPMVEHVLDAVAAAGVERAIVVVGHQADRVREALAGRGVEFVLQAQQLGTGHAVMMAAPLLEGDEGDTVVLAGDVPLIRPATIAALADNRRRTGAAVTVLTAILEDATGYGRIIRDARDRVVAIREHRDCSPAELAVREMNSSIYAFHTPFLLGALPRIGRNNEQAEYYLTDTVELAAADGLDVDGLVVPDFEEVSGINTVDQLGEAERALLARDRA